MRYNYNGYSRLGSSEAGFGRRKEDQMKHGLYTRQTVDNTDKAVTKQRCTVDLKCVLHFFLLCW